jgi:hypothetical protein
VSKAFVELNERGNRALVHFRYDPVIKDRVKAIGGARFIDKEKPGGPAWQLPLDLVAMRQLREVFGNELELGAGIREWGREVVAREQKLQLPLGVGRCTVERIWRSVRSSRRWLSGCVPTSERT